MRGGSFTRIGIATIAATSLAVVGGCGDDDDDGGSAAGTTEPADAQPAPLAISTSGTGKAATYTVPASVRSGVAEIAFTNRLKGPVDAQLLRFDAGHTAAETVKLVTADADKTPSWLHGAGGVSTVAPGQTGTVTQVLAPGNYVIVSPDPDATPVKPAEFTVTGSAPADATLPEVPGSIVAKEYGFDITGLKAGTNEVSFKNTGREMHHAILAPVIGNPTQAEITKFLQSEGEGGGKPPFDFKKITGTAVLDRDQQQNTELTLTKGRWIALCFISDRAGGPPHVAKGMLKQFDVE